MKRRYLDFVARQEADRAWEKEQAELMLLRGGKGGRDTEEAEETESQGEKVTEPERQAA